MDLVGNVLSLDKTEAEAIKDHIETYGLSMGGMKIRIDVVGKTIDFIGVEGIALRLEVGAV